MNIPISQSDVAEAAAYSVAHAYLTKNKFVPEPKAVVMDLVVAAMVNFAGPAVDENLFFGKITKSMGPQVNRIAKYVLAEIALGVLQGEKLTTTLKETARVTNLAAIGAGVMAGAAFKQTYPEGLLSMRPGGATVQEHKEARSHIAAANPLTSEGV